MLILGKSPVPTAGMNPEFLKHADKGGPYLQALGLKGEIPCFSDDPLMNLLRKRQAYSKG